MTSEITNGIVECIIQNGDSIWFGTDSGLFCYHTQSKILQRWTTNDRLNHISVKDIMIDKNENMWIGTNKGLNLMNLKTGIIEKVRALDDSLESLRTNMIYFVFVNEDTIWIGTNNSGHAKLTPVIGNDKYKWKYKSFIPWLISPLRFPFLSCSSNISVGGGFPDQED